MEEGGVKGSRYCSIKINEGPRERKETPKGVFIYLFSHTEGRNKSQVMKPNREIRGWRWSVKGGDNGMGNVVKEG